MKGNECVCNLSMRLKYFRWSLGVETGNETIYYNYSPSLWRSETSRKVATVHVLFQREADISDTAP